ncbi:multidrug resistance protein D [Legionella beliardensis]|uniref:Multidrug resistance protein D n=1 Tax=Legionella beliardensis TaxID=91822 RepID=A0A378JSI2_9GAMM|nr:MFS transporter [Legionella beliardensis]STX55548.1 multidrug resistance protein D [Legionella beliardensis]
MTILTWAPNKLIIFAIANGLVAQFAMDIYIPAMPAIAKALHTTIDYIQLSYFYFMLGFGLSVFLYGFLNKIINYRYIFLICNGVFLIATLLIIFSADMVYFLALRFLQGMGAGFGSMAIIITIIYLFFPPRKLGIIISYSVFFLTLANILAPAIGGYLQELYGWQSSFIFLFILSFLLLTSGYCFLPKIITPPKVKISFYSKVKNLLANQQYITHAIYAIICVNIIVCYLVMSSFILQMHLGASIKVSGAIASLISLLFSMGSLLNTFMLSRYLLKTTIFSGLIISFLGIATFLIAGYFTGTSIFAFIIPIFISSLGLGILYPNFVTCGFKDFTGFIIDGTSLLSLMKIFTICLITAFIAFIPDNFLTCALLTGFLFSLLLVLILILNREYLVNY